MQSTEYVLDEYFLGRLFNLINTSDFLETFLFYYRSFPFFFWILLISTTFHIWFWNAHTVNSSVRFDFFARFLIASDYGCFTVRDSELDLP